MGKQISLTVKKSTRPAEVTNLVPGDYIFKDGKGGVITDVKGQASEGILHWRIDYINHLNGIRNSHFTFMYKLCKI